MFGELTTTTVKNYVQFLLMMLMVMMMTMMIMSKNSLDIINKYQLSGLFQVVSERKFVFLRSVLHIMIFPTHTRIYIHTHQHTRAYKQCEKRFFLFFTCGVHVFGKVGTIFFSESRNNTVLRYFLFFSACCNIYLVDGVTRNIFNAKRKTPTG
jgi:hypothetical protein